VCAFFECKSPPQAKLGTLNWGFWPQKTGETSNWGRPAPKTGETNWGRKVAKTGEIPSSHLYYSKQLSDRDGKQRVSPVTHRGVEFETESEKEHVQPDGFSELV
jgi:hypothetical protein